MNVRERISARRHRAEPKAPEASPTAETTAERMITMPLADYRRNLSATIILADRMRGLREKVDFTSTGPMITKIHQIEDAVTGAIKNPSRGLRDVDVQIGYASHPIHRDIAETLSLYDGQPSVVQGTEQGGLDTFKESAIPGLYLVDNSLGEDHVLSLRGENHVPEWVKTILISEPEAERSHVGELNQPEMISVPRQNLEVLRSMQETVSILRTNAQEAAEGQDRGLSYFLHKSASNIDRAIIGTVLENAAMGDVNIYVAYVRGYPELHGNIMRILKSPKYPESVTETSESTNYTYYRAAIPGFFIEEHTLENDTSVHSVHLLGENHVSDEVKARLSKTEAEKTNA